MLFSVLSYYVYLIRLFLCDGALHKLGINDNRIKSEDFAPVKCI